MKILIAALLLMVIVLQYRLWVGEGSIAHQVELQKAIEQQSLKNHVLLTRNRNLALEVEALKIGTEGIEERAREDLGMIKEGETFFMLIDSNNRTGE
ncbi:MAG: septum formation initiator family protein [Cellvibrionaceae bacterium]|nr:septum formation initiator family protein [Cellvibrionaceae bacterium]